VIGVKDVVDALRGCLDPELGASIIDIGLVYGISVSGGRDVRVRLTMTSPMCPLTGAILSDAQLRLEALHGVGKVALELVWDPLWNPEMMSESMRFGQS
jgi:metal-sulfur cluster biosynthetic enzyme